MKLLRLKPVLRANQVDCAPLLNVAGYEYAGVVPRAVRYPRHKYRFASAPPAGEAADDGAEQAGDPTRPDPTQPTDADEPVDV